MSEEKVTMKVDTSEELSTAQKEEKALKKTGFSTEEKIHKVDLSKPPKTETDAVQEQSADEVSLRDESDSSKEVSEENTEKQDEVITEQGKEKEELRVQTQEETVIEKVEEAELEAENTKAEENFTKEAKEEIKKETKQELPEGVEKLVDFLKDNPGSDLEDFVRLNKDYTNSDEKVLLKEYYKHTKKHFSNEDIDFLLEDKFSYDEDIDDERDIKRKKLAYKEEVEKAKNFLKETKDKYYSEIKLKQELNPETQKAKDFFDRYKQEQSTAEELQRKQSERFDNLTNNVFNENFKGFDFKVKDGVYRYNVKDKEGVRKKQSDVMNVLGSFLDENNMLKDAKGYHKALFAAQNADGIANHFYEQGKADAIRELNSNSKNINMNPRNTSDGVIDAGGMKIRAVSGNDSSKLKIRFKN